MHGSDITKVGEAGVCEFLAAKRMGDDSDDVAAGRERGIGENAHEPDITAAGNDSDVVLSEVLGERSSRGGVAGTSSGARAAEDADSLGHGDFSG